MKQRPTKQIVTLKDIAKKTGYSINTVSRALRDKDDISPETRAFIKNTSKEMGHISNMLASSLRLGYTKTIAIILGDVSNPHFAIMMKEIEERARQLGYNSILMNTSEDEDLEFTSIQMALNKNVDGIIICPTQKSDKNIKYLKDIGIPFVLIGRYYENIETDYVICNDKMGGFIATKHLLENGHRRILMLNAPIYISSAKERLDGYRSALQVYNIPINPELICEVSATAENTENIFEELIKDGLNFTAIFAFSDILAWEVWDYLKKRNYSVPNDVSIIGFDNICSRMSLPVHLTSISSQKGRMSVSSVNCLIDKLTSETPMVHKIVLDTELVKGESVLQIEI